MFFGFQEPPKPTPPPPVVIEKLSPTLEDYELLIDKYKKTTADAFVMSAWKNVKLSNKKTKEEIAFNKLSEYEQQVFVLAMASRTTKELRILAECWDEEIAEFSKPEHKLIFAEKITSPKQKAADKEDVEGYQKQLRAIRKKFAEEYEKHVDFVFAAYKKEIPEKEAFLYRKQVLELHDKEKLIERK